MKKPDQNMLAWIDARKRHHLSDTEVQMARELGMNPRNLGGIDNHRQEPWKMPLRQFIHHLYFKQFGKERPDVALSVEEKVRREEERKVRQRAEKLKQRQSRVPSDGSREHA